MIFIKARPKMLATGGELSVCLCMPSFMDTISHLSPEFFQILHMHFFYQSLAQVRIWGLSDILSKMVAKCSALDLLSRRHFLDNKSISHIGVNF